MKFPRESNKHHFASYLSSFSLRWRFKQSRLVERCLLLRTKIYLNNKNRELVKKICLSFYSRITSNLLVTCSSCFEIDDENIKKFHHRTHQLSANQSRRIHHRKQVKMKFIVTILLLLCLVKSNIARKRCGVVADKCITLSTGTVYWPSDWTAECSSVPIAVRLQTRKANVGKSTRLLLYSEEHGQVPGV